MAQASRTRHPVAHRALAWLSIVLLVALSLVGPGTTGVSAAVAPPDVGTGGSRVAQAPQPPFGDLRAGTSNPALPTDVCEEADFGFAIDRSGSIQSAGASTAQKNGIKGFVDAFAGSGLYAGTRFGGSSATNITSGFLGGAAFKSNVDGMPTPTGRTPTGLGVANAAANTANDRASAPNVLFVVSDGSPNVPDGGYNYPDDPRAWLTGANAAIDAANAARAAGWVVLAIYVGAPDSGLPFSSANDQAWVEAVMSRIGGGSFTQIANFSGLADALLISTGCAVPPGSLKITKNITEDTAGFAGGTFDFAADCGQAGIFPASVTIASGGTTGSTTIANIPAGASCTVSETGTPAPGTDFQWKAPSISPNSVTIVSEQAVEVTVTNPRDFVEAPALGVKKTAKTASYNEAGDLLAYEIVATNTGNVTLTNVTISDPKLGTLACSPALGSSLAPGAKMTCTGTYTTVQGDVDAGKVDNTATADSAQTPPVNDSATVPAVQAPALGVKKTAKTASYNEAGDLLAYEIVATNTGNVTLTNVTISDPKLGTLACSPALGSSLAPGAKMTCTGTYTTVQGDVDAGKVDNTATADSAQTPPVNDSATVPAVQAPALTLDKSATPATYSAVGNVVSYSYKLTNSGNVTLAGPFTVTDDKATASCPASPSSLAPGAVTTCTASHTITQADLDAGKVTNVAQGHARFGEQAVNSNTDTETVTAVQGPALTLEKTAKTASYNEAGDLLAYEIVATNTGNVTLHSVMVIDPKLASLSCNPAQEASLAPGATMTCTGTYTTTQGDVDAGKVDNTATAYSAETKPVNDSATVPAITGPALGIVKTATTASYARPGDVISYKIVATNLGNVTLHGVTISDPKLGTLACSPAQPATLNPNAALTCTGTYKATQADIDAGKVDNTATADSDETNPVSASAQVPAVQSPALAVTKDVRLGAGGTFAPSLTTTVGTTVQYRIVVSNTGNVTLTGITLADSLSNLVAKGCTIPASLAVGASFTCDYTETAKAGTTANVATADSAQTSPVTDSATVYAPPPTALIVEKQLDLDPSPDVTTLVPGGAGWVFALGGDPAMKGTTGTDGTFTFDLTGIDGSTTVDVTETILADFEIQSASCAVVSGAQAEAAAARGTFDKAAAAMTGVKVNSGETVKCTFVNVSGATEAATATPRVTPPPTDTLPTSGTPGGASLQILLLVMAGLLASTLMLVSATPKAVRRRR